MSIFDRDDIYVDNYYEYPGFHDRERHAANRNVTSDQISDDYLAGHSLTIVSRFALTLLLRIGFLLVQIGSVPVTNVNLIMLQNIVDFSCVTLVYVLAGYVIAYNGDLNGLIGEGHWIGKASTNKEEAIIGWQAIAIASAISTSCTVGRSHTVGYLFVGTLMAGLLQPFVIHWAWTSKGWMAHNTLRDRNVEFRDYAGSAIVHLVGSSTGFIGCVILGRRILRLRDIDDASVPADSAGTAFAGYSLILLGLQGLCLPSTSESNPMRREGKHMSLVVVNNLLASSACSLSVVALHFFLSREPFNHWTVMRCIQASIAGTIIVSAGVDVYSPILCLGLGCTGGILYYLVSRKIFESALEDYCNIVATHLTCALVGTFVAPFCRTSTAGVYDAYTMIINVAWQLICLVAIVILIIVTMIPAFMILECFGLLRNRSEFVNHLRAIVALERGPPRSYMQRIFFSDSETLYLQPGSASVQPPVSIVGTRFTKYQCALAKLEKSKINELSQTRKSVNPETIIVTPEPSIVLETRMKKFRHVHTIRPTSEGDIPEIVGHADAMGDNRISLDNDNKADKFTQENITSSYTKKLMEIPEKLTEITPEKIETGISMRVKKKSYRLHRTQKCTNLRFDAITENDGVKFLVKPRPSSFSSSQSDSDSNEEKIIDGKYESSKFDVKIDDK